VTTTTLRAAPLPPPSKKPLALDKGNPTFFSKTNIFLIDIVALNLQKKL
jgi:hypothetical protein